MHLSSAPALAEVRKARERGVDVIAETCPQYLYLDTARLADPDGESFVCTPPLRDPWHVEELWHGHRDGRGAHRRDRPLPVHRRRPPRRRARRDRRATPTSPRSPAACPGIETRMGLVWEGVRAGRITRADWVRLCAEAPARTFGLWPAKGNLRVGADADVVVWDPDRAQSLDASALHMAVDHSPYAGMVVTGWPELVLSRGDVVARDGRYVGEPARGRFVSRSPRLVATTGAESPRHVPAFAAEAGEAGPVPRLFAALTAQVYVLPEVSPLTVSGPFLPDFALETPPFFEVHAAVYFVIAAPLSTGTANVTLSDPLPTSRPAARRSPSAPRPLSPWRAARRDRRRSRSRRQR